MALPIVTKETVHSFIRDLAGDNEDLSPSAIAANLQNDNPRLLEALTNLAASDAQALGNMLYVCELISRQSESDALSKRWN